jgi:hypothetical protein
MNAAASRPSTGRSTASCLTSTGSRRPAKHDKPEDLTHIPAGPDPAVQKAIQKKVDAGFDHIALTGIGDDQKAFTRFFANELLPDLERKSVRSPRPAAID